MRFVAVAVMELVAYPLLLWDLVVFVVLVVKHDLNVLMKLEFGENVLAVIAQAKFE